MESFWGETRAHGTATWTKIGAHAKQRLNLDVINPMHGFWGRVEHQGKSTFANIAMSAKGSMQNNLIKPVDEFFGRLLGNVRMPGGGGSGPTIYPGARHAKGGHILTTPAATAAPAVAQGEDNQLILATPGEFVVRKSAVKALDRQFGPAFLPDFINKAGERLTGAPSSTAHSTPGVNVQFSTVSKDLADPTLSVGKFATGGFIPDAGGLVPGFASGGRIPGYAAGGGIAGGFDTAFVKVDRDFQRLVEAPINTWLNTGLSHAFKAANWWDSVLPAFRKEVQNPIVAFIQSGINGQWNNSIHRWFDSVLPTFNKQVQNGIGNFINHTVNNWWNNSIGRWFDSVWHAFQNAFGGNLNNFINHTVNNWWNSSIGRWFDSTWHAFQNGFGGNLNNFINHTVNSWWNNSIGRWFDSVGSTFHSQVNNPIMQFINHTVQGGWNNSITKWFDSVGPAFVKNVERPMTNFFTGALPKTIEAAFKKSINFTVGKINDVITSIDKVTGSVGVKISTIPEVHAEGREIGEFRRTGPGSVGGAGDHDTQPILATPGEYVVRKSARMALDRTYGPQFLNSAINHADKYLGYASGGPVSAGPSFVSPGRGTNFAAGGYINPLKNIRGLIPERIDMGVDFGGTGNLLAMGSGRVNSPFLTGWGGAAPGEFMTYTLSSGPYAGRMVYYSEGINPLVHPGQSVHAGQALANMHAAIEVGWAGDSTHPLSQLPIAGSISGSNLPPSGATKVGKNFDELLVSLGVPKAPNFNSPTGGLLPKNFPTAPGGGGGGQVTFGKKAVNALAALGGLPEGPLDKLLKKSGGSFSLDDLWKNVIGPDEKAWGLIPGKGIVPQIGLAAFDSLKKAYDAKIAAAAPQGGVPGGPVGAGALGVARALVAEGYHNAAAAGITGCMAGEAVPPFDPESTNCVPLTYKVVTRRGNLAPEDVRVGDRTPVYNPAGNRMEDATVLNVPYHHGARICRIGNQRWSVICTWDHKWITDTGELVRADRMEIGATKVLLGAGWLEPVEFFEDRGQEDTFCLTTTTGTWTAYRDEDVAREEGVEPGAFWTGNSGGFGLIGWTFQTAATPPRPTGNRQKDLRAQIAAVPRWPDNGDNRPDMNTYTDPLKAGVHWSEHYERPKVTLSDWRPSVAQTIFAQLGNSSPSPAKKQRPGSPGSPGGHVKHAAGGLVRKLAGGGEVPDLPFLKELVGGYRMLASPPGRRRGDPAMRYATGGEIASYAEKFKGHRYVLGGSGDYQKKADPPFGPWDCAGYVGEMYRHFGINAPFPGINVTALDHWGKSSGPETGGMAFWVTDGSRAHPGHVGMVTGPGRSMQAMDPALGTRAGSLAGAIRFRVPPHGFTSGSGKGGGGGGGGGAKKKAPPPTLASLGYGSTADNVISAILAVTSNKAERSAMLLGADLESGWNPRAVKGTDRAGAFLMTLGGKDKVTKEQAENTGWAARHLLPMFQKGVALAGAKAYPQDAELAAAYALEHGNSFYRTKGAGGVDTAWAKVLKILGSQAGLKPAPGVPGTSPGDIAREWSGAVSKLASDFKSEDKEFKVLDAALRKGGKHKPLETVLASSQHLMDFLYGKMSDKGSLVLSKTSKEGLDSLLVAASGHLDALQKNGKLLARVAPKQAKTVTQDVTNIVAQVKAAKTAYAAESQESEAERVWLLLWNALQKAEAAEKKQYAGLIGHGAQKGAPPKPVKKGGKGGGSGGGGGGALAAGEVGYIQRVMRDLHAPADQNNIRSLERWAKKEFPRYPPSAKWNLMASTMHMPGSTRFNSVGVQNYRSEDQGAEATARTLDNGRYPHIVKALRSGRGLIGNPSIAGELRTWSGGGYSGRRCQASSAPSPGQAPPSGQAPSEAAVARREAVTVERGAGRAQAVARAVRRR